MCAFGFQLLPLHNVMGLLAYIVGRVPLCRMESWTQYGLPCCLKPAYACLQFEVVSHLTTEPNELIIITIGTESSAGRHCSTKS